MITFKIFGARQLVPVGLFFVVTAAGTLRGDLPPYSGGKPLTSGLENAVPYLKRLDYEDAERQQGIVMPERGRRPLLEKSSGAGRAIYLNLSPLSYFDHSERAVLDLVLTRPGGWKNAVNRRSGEVYAETNTITLRWDPFDAVVIECDR